jgi:hypothetical protein
MNFWTPHSDFKAWSQGLDLSTLPWTVEYDYVEVWSYDQTTKEFNLAWRDEFDTDAVDATRWSLSDNWQINGSDTKFMSG